MTTKTKRFKFADIKRAKYNPRVTLTPADQEYQDILASIREFGALGGLVLNIRTMTLVAGHQRMTILEGMGEDAADFAVVDIDETSEKRLNVILNKVAGKWNVAALEELIRDLGSAKVDISTLGFTPAEIDGILNPPNRVEAAKFTLAQRFMIPPFSVLSAREGWWQDRKTAWINLGIKSEVGRGGNLLKMSETILEPDPKKRAAKKSKK